MKRVGKMKHKENIGNRISVMYLNELYGTKKFFLTDFLNGHYKCVAIDKADCCKRLENILCRNYSVWEKDNTLYILGKKQKDKK